MFAAPIQVHDVDKLVIQPTQENINKFHSLFKAVGSSANDKVNIKSANSAQVAQLKAIKSDPYVQQQAVEITKKLLSLKKMYSDSKYVALKTQGMVLYKYIKEKYPQAVKLMSQYAALQMKEHPELRDQKNKSVPQVLDYIFKNNPQLQQQGLVKGTTAINTNVEANAEAVANVVAASNAVAATNGIVAAEVFVVVAVFII